MGRRSGAVRRRRDVVSMEHDAGVLVCSNCGHVVSPNEISFSCDFDGGLLVSCFLCAPALMEVLDTAFASGTTYRDGWRRHCAGEVDCFDGYVMRGSSSSE